MKTIEVQFSDAEFAVVEATAAAVGIEPAQVVRTATVEHLSDLASKAPAEVSSAPKKAAAAPVGGGGLRISDL